MMQRGGAISHQQKLLGDMGMRHGESGGSGMGNGNGAQPSKRWSVPSFPHGGPPVYVPGPHQGQGVGDAHHHHHAHPPMQQQQQQQQQQPPWGGWPKHGGKAVGSDVNGQYMGFSDNRSFRNKVAGNALSLSDPWSSPHWAAPPAGGGGGGGGFPSPQPTHYNGLALPVSSQQSQEDTGTGSGGNSSRVKTGRSVSCVTEPSWSSLASREVGEEVGGAAIGGTDLVQLMKSLDISSEHMQSLKVCTCMSASVHVPVVTDNSCLGSQAEFATATLHV